MDYRAMNQTYVLKVNISCCKGCQAKVEKALLKIDGVYSITTDAEKGTVIVLGKVDPKALIQVLAKKGKKAELLSYEEPMNDKNQHDDQSKNNHSGQGQDKSCRPDKKHVRGKEKVQDCRCEDHLDHDEGDKHEQHSRTRKDFDDHVCKDDHCNIHNRNFIIGNNCLPQHRQEHFYWDDPLYRHPPYGDGLLDHRHYGYRHQHIRPIVYDRPLPPYDPYHPRMVPPAYGYHPRRPL